MPHQSYTVKAYTYISQSSQSFIFFTLSLQTTPLIKYGLDQIQFNSGLIPSQVQRRYDALHDSSPGNDVS